MTTQNKSTPPQYTEEDRRAAVSQKVQDLIAAEIDRAVSSRNDEFNRDKRRLWLGVWVLTTGMFLSVIVAAFIFVWSPLSERTELSDRLATVSNDLAKLQGQWAAASADEVTNPNATTSPQDPAPPLTDLIDQVQELAAASAEMASAPAPALVSFGQVLPVGALVLILGILGVRRMQGYDREIAGARIESNAAIDSLRVFLRDELRDGQTIQQKRLSESRKETQAELKSIRDQMIKASTQEVREAVDQAMAEQSDTVDTVRKEFNGQVADREKDLQELDERIATANKELQEFAQANPWLRTEEASKLVEIVNNIASAGEARSVADRFNTEKPPNYSGARKVLARVADGIDGQPLPGTADDYHNSYIQAIRAVDPSLARRIALQGLKVHPAQHDLIGDLFQSLDNGPDEALQKVLDENLGRLRESGAMWVSWRPSVFLADRYASDGSSEGLQKAVEVLTEAIGHNRFEPKYWRTLAECLTKLGDPNQAHQTYIDGLNASPYSQSLRVAFGEFLLSTGKAKDAAEQYERALAVDFQDQYQHDIDQSSVLVGAAQANEAAGNTKRAVALYQQADRAFATGQLISRVPTVVTYVKNRLALLGDVAAGHADEDDTNDPLDGKTGDDILDLLQGHESEQPKPVVLGLFKEALSRSPDRERVRAAAQRILERADLTDDERETFRHLSSV